MIYVSYITYECDMNTLFASRYLRHPYIIAMHAAGATISQLLSGCHRRTTNSATILAPHNVDNTSKEYATK